MANEITVHSSFDINNGSLQFRGLPSSFTASMVGKKGPTPGAITVLTTGTDVDLSQLTTPGMCQLTNLDTINVIEYGIWDPETTKYYPLGELLPGESYGIRLSRNLQWEYAGVGTGTTGPETNKLRLRSSNTTCNAVVSAFEA